MELDKTSIVLRQRSLLELIDLSLVVLRVYWRPLIFQAALGALPFFILNFFVLRPMTDYERLLVFSDSIIDQEPLQFRYAVFMFAMVMLEAPLAYLGVTYWLGQAVFFEKPSMKEFGAVVFRLFGGIFWSLGILRLSLLGILFCGIAAWSSEWNPVYELFWLGTVLVGIAMAIRAFRPFAPELLVLERTPLFAKKHPGHEPSMNYGRRSKWLHRAISGELFGRFIAMVFAMCCVLVSLTLGELFVFGIFLGTWSWGWWMEHLLFPVTVWFVALWGCIFRLLSYLDSRTRLEGWELELRLKAEAARLVGAPG